MIAKTKEEGLEEVKRLVEKFELNENQYKNESYNEEQLKTEFLNPFFKALGWDVNNQEDFAPQYKEVVFEDSIKVGNKTKAPDYAFRLGGQRIFFLEAKKPSRDIKNDKDHAFQVRRYGWSAKLKGSVLSDFEELAIYETQTKPESKQNAGVGRLKYYKYDEYIEKWDEIWDLLSKEAVMKGKFDKFFTANEKAKGTSTVDEEFLKEINEWRELLAKNIALRNEGLSISELNYAVQLIIDRIIFFRMAEDRGIQKYKTLYNLLDKDEIYKSFADLCKQADAKYNSGLFHFSKESKDDVTVDNFTLDLNIDNSVFKTIFKNLYYPNSPYEFSMISPEILGNIYEQFLGKTITLTKGHRAKIIEKPEVKKAGGVYYTPNFIVKYIVENTVGELLKGKTPNKVSNIKILDPACGSGSFLLEAYQYLLDWHLDYYRNLEKPPKNTIFQAKNGEYYLTIQEKKRILLNNIYGVDLDVNAVEVTKLSLLLKVLENQNKDVLEAQQKLFQERVLPNLSNNIKCGNSLISTDIYNEDISFEEASILNPFDWEDEFSNVFENGGFDAVIGNPPYFNIQTLGNNSIYANYLKSHYEVYMDKSDILFYFIERSIQMSKKYVEFIISNAFLFANKGVNLRNYIIDNAPISKIINFENYKVFNAGISTAIVQFDKNKKDTKADVLVLSDKNYDKNDLVNHFDNSQNYFKVNFEKDSNFSLVSEQRKKLNDKIDKDSKILGDLFLVGKGMETAADKIFSFKEKPTQFPENNIKKRVTGVNIDKYHINNKNSKYVLYFEDIENFKDLDDSIKNYLMENKRILKDRATVKNEGRIWWRYSRPMHKEYYNLPKIFCSRRAKTNIFAMDNSFKWIPFSNMTVIFGNNEDLDLRYVLCLLNSNLLTYRYQSIGKMTGANSYEYFPNGVGKLPIKVIDKKDQEVFINLADEVDNLKTQLENVKDPKQKKILKQKIAFEENKVNQLVYDLYGLNEDEIEIVEESIK